MCHFQWPNESCSKKLSATAITPIRAFWRERMEIQFCEAESEIVLDSSHLNRGDGFFPEERF